MKNFDSIKIIAGVRVGFVIIPKYNAEGFIIGFYHQVWAEGDDCIFRKIDDTYIPFKS